MSEGMGPADVFQYLAGLSFKEFQRVPLEYWAQYAAHGPNSLLKAEGRRWLREWDGMYDSKEAREAFVHSLLGWMEWSDRTWKHCQRLVGSANDLESKNG